MKITEDNKIDNESDLISELTSYEFVKNNLYFTLVNKTKNEKLQSDCVTYEFLDMLLVPNIKVTSFLNEVASVKVTYNLLETYGITKEELYFDVMRVANINMPYYLQTMEDILKKMLLDSGAPEDIINDLLNLSESNDDKMYVLSNVANINGASALAYFPINKFAKKIDSDIIVLPSSIHEVILVPVQDNITNEELLELVRNTNRTEVSVEEQLSDNVYIYKRESDSYEIIE